MANNIRRFRVKKGLSQKQLADHLLVSQQAISKYEIGIAKPKVETYLKIAKVLDTTITKLSGNAPVPKEVLVNYTKLDDSGLMVMEEFEHLSKNQQYAVANTVLKHYVLEENERSDEGSPKE